MRKSLEKALFAQWLKVERGNIVSTNAKQRTEAEKDLCGFVTHTGLAYQKYIATISDWNKPKRDPELTKFFLEMITKAEFNGYPAKRDEWEQAMKGSGAKLYTATLLSRMTVGLGAGSPTENGLAFHHTYGVPMIPGSTIKGAMRAAAQEMLGLGDFDPANEEKDILAKFSGAQPLFDTFGSVDRMGAITVYDALPQKAECLVDETWTPHYMKYGGGDAGLPRDIEDPNPLSLLAVQAGTTFTFAIQLPAPEWEAPILHVLDKALQNGLGAKNSQGYGRFDTSGLPVIQANPEPEVLEIEFDPTPIPVKREKKWFFGTVVRKEGSKWIGKVKDVELSLYPPIDLKLEVGMKVSCYILCQDGNFIGRTVEKKDLKPFLEG